MRRKTLLLVAVVALILTSAALILAATPAPKEPGKAYGKWMTLIIPQPDGTELHSAAPAAKERAHKEHPRGAERNATARLDRRRRSDR